MKFTPGILIMEIKQEIRVEFSPPLYLNNMILPSYVNYIEMTSPHHMLLLNELQPNRPSVKTGD
jgi:hypothetical protein